MVEKIEKNPLEMSEDEFHELSSPDAKISEFGKDKELLEAYRNIIDITKKYCDWKESYYPIVAVWIIGTYFHDKMITYPYLYFNASKESGKSRSVRLITFLSWEGEMVNSMTEAVLFRTKGTLGIDEFEKASRKGSENFMELLNSAYKKGVKVKRMKRQKTAQGGEEMVVEDFDVFRPIVLANIWGMDQVLEDRTLPLYLEKTTSQKIGNLLEIWEHEKITTFTKKILHTKMKLCNVVSLQKVYLDYNQYLINNYITSGDNNYITTLFKKIRASEINGRMLELSFPLLIISSMIDEKITDIVMESLKEISLEKKHEAFLENKDIILMDMVSQQPLPTTYQSIRSLTDKFKQFTQSDDDWINERWVGRALKRMSLIEKKKRSERGIEVILDVQKAIDKIEIFGEKESITSPNNSNSSASSDVGSKGGEQ